MKKIPALLTSLLIALSAFSQTTPDSCRLRLSLITVAPGDDLYSLFGHTGIRLIDSARNADVVFNYGTFDDSDPYFYLKFTRGIMRYSLSVWPYPAFMEEYKAERRNVSEQVLNIDCAARQRLVKALIDNAQEANRYYDYQFYFDNCTTRSRDIIARYGCPAPVEGAGKREAAGAGIGCVHFGNILPDKHPSFRNLIHSYLDKGKQPWSKLAIDLLLGAHLDAIVSNQQAMFLPDYLAKGFDSARIGNRPLVCETLPLLAMPEKTPEGSWFTPLTIFTVLLIIFGALTFVKAPGAQKAVNFFDRLLFLLTGLLGVMIWLVWITRVDTVCSNNWNTLWALPTHTVMAFMLRKKKSWIKIYWGISSLLLLVLLAGWKWWPQELDTDLLPLIVLLLIRSIAQWKKQTTRP